MTIITEVVSQDRECRHLVTSATTLLQDDTDITIALPDGLWVVLHRRVMQGRHAVRDASVDVGAELDEGGEDVGVVERCRHDDRTHEPELTALVDVRPSLFDQQARHGVEAVAH